MTKYYTVKEITEELQISRATLYRWIDEGLPHRIMGARTKIFDLKEVQEFQMNRRAESKMELVVGKEYSNTDIVGMFRVGHVGAVRKSNSKNVIVLIHRVDYFDLPLRSYWKDDVLYYAGAIENDRKWDEIMSNRILISSKDNSTPIYLFEIFSNNMYCYRGIAKIDGAPIVEETNIPLMDFDKEERCSMSMKKIECVKFPLRLVNDKDFLKEEFVVEEELVQQKEIDLMPRKEILEAAMKAIDQPVSERTVITKRFQRNPAVWKYARMRANGYCELCGQKAPFEYEGEPYLQIDHIIPIAKGGTDTIDNVAAVCPNCCCRKGLLVDDEMIRTLKRNIAKNELRLREELGGE